MLCEQKRDGQLQHRSRNITPCPPYEKFSLTDWSGRAMTVERSSIGLQFPHYRPFQQPIFLDRTMQFWLRAIPIYASYKICQLRIQFYSKDSREQLWEEQHEWAADKVYSLCSELGGFFLKVAQLIGKPDLAPKAWVKKLVTLCDSAPPTSYSIVKCALEYELGSTVEDLFEYFDCKPIGSASVAQVHRARLKGAKKDVAVKVQHPGVEVLMMNDIRNLRTFAALVQCFDLKFDVLSAVDELEEQVGLEFDFQREARSMDRIANSISAYYKARPPVFVPRSIPSLVTRRVLVMQFMEGTPIMQLGDEMARRGINPSGAMAKLAKQNILKSLTEAYGHMILRDGFFQADPHPGNLLIMEEGKVALLDYGQVKEFTNPIRLGYAKLVVAIAAQNPYDIDQSFKELGVVLGKRVESDPKSYMQMASNLFDTKLPPGRTRADPFGEDALLQKVQVKNFPKDLFFVLRTIQILRGLSVGMEVPLSCVENWKNIAKEALSVAHEEMYGFNIKATGKGFRDPVWERRKRARRLWFLQQMAKELTALIF